MGWPKRDKSGCIMTQFGQSKPMQDCNDMPLFRGIFAGTLPGQIGTNRDNFPPADAPQSGQFGTPPLKGGVQCPAGTGVGMSRVPDDPAAAFKTRNDIKVAFDAWTDAGQPWPPPVGLTSAIASRLIPRREPQHGKRWR